MNQRNICHWSTFLYVALDKEILFKVKSKGQHTIKAEDIIKNLPAVNGVFRIIQSDSL